MNLIFSIEHFNEKLGEILNDDEVIRKKTPFGTLFTE